MKVPEHPAQERISLQHIGEVILAQLNLERGLAYTIRRLVRTPRAAMQEYLFENRRRMVAPLPLLLLTVGIATFLSYQFLDLETELALRPEQEGAWNTIPAGMRTALQFLLSFSRQYFNLVLISAIPFQALASFYVFGKQQLYFAEHLVINTYIYSIQTLLVIPLMLLIYWLPSLETAIGGGIGALSIGYLFYAFILIFEQNWQIGIVKTLLTYFLAQTLYGLGIIGVILLTALFL